MLATRSPFPQYFDIDGDPLDAGFLYFGAAGMDAEASPLPIYWDADGAVPAAQPVRTINGYTMRSGTAALVYAPGDYSITVRDRHGALVFSAASSQEFDNAFAQQQALARLTTAGNASLGPGLIPYSATLPYPAGSLGARLGREVWADLRTTNTGTQNDAAVLAAAAACQAAGGGTVLLPGDEFQHVSISWDVSLYPKVGLRGAGKNGTNLRKAGSSTTPVLNVFASALAEWFGSIEDLSIEGNAKGSPGLRTTLLGIVNARNLRITGASIGWENVGSLIAIAQSVDLRANAVGYRATKSGAVYPNLITFQGGQCIGNTSIGYDLVHGHGIKFDGVDVEQNGVFGDATTGGIFVRSTVTEEISFGTMTLSNAWFESNRGRGLVVENASGLMLTVDEAKFIRNNPATDGTAASIGAIESSMLRQVFAVAAGGDTISIAAARSTVDGGLIHTLIDTSTVRTHKMLGTSTELIVLRVQSAGGTSELSPEGLVVGGAKFSHKITLNGNTFVDLPLSTYTGVGSGAKVLISGADSLGAAFAREYLLAVAVTGGSGAAVTAVLVGTAGSATPAFAFTDAGGMVRCAATGNNVAQVVVIGG